MLNRPRPNRISREPASNQELELQRVNQELQNTLNSEVDIKRKNEKTIDRIERELQIRDDKIKSLQSEIESNI